MTSTPEVSVVLPCYNAAQYAQRAVERLLEQDSADLEIVLVDDASKDDTAAILTRLAEQNDRVRVVLLAENGGVAAAREAAVQVARGTYVWFVDADDEWPVNAVSLLVEAAKATDADIVCASARVVAEGQAPRTVGRLPAASAITGAEALHELLLGNLTGHLWNKLFRRDPLGRITFTRIRQHSDQAMVAQAFVEARTVSILRECVYTYRLRGGSIIRSGSRRADSLRLLGEVVAQSVARVDATGLRHPDYRYYRARYNLLSRLKDATSGSYSPAERTALVGEVRREMSLSGAAALARRKDATRLGLYALGWVSPRAYGTLLDRAGGRL